MRWRDPQWWRTCQYLRGAGWPHDKLPKHPRPTPDAAWAHVNGSVGLSNANADGMARNALAAQITTIMRILVRRLALERVRKTVMKPASRPEVAQTPRGHPCMRRPGGTPCLVALTGHMREK